MLSRRRAALVAALMAALMAVTPGLAGEGVVAAAEASPASSTDGLDAVVISDPRLSESSGLALSPLDPDLLYTVNDSGHEPVVYVIDSSGGADSRVVGTAALAGVDSPDLDPEALAVGTENMLWVADVGDNDTTRTDIALYALPAPGPGDRTVRPVRYPLTYPGTQRDDAEALVADPVSGAMWVITKGWFDGSVFEVPQPLVADQPNRLRSLPGVEVPPLVTDATLLAGSEGAVVRTYVDAHVYTLPDWGVVGRFPLPRQEQGEALAALPDAGGLLAGSEGTPTRIDRVDVPPDLLASLDRPREPTEGAPREPRPPSGSAADDGTVLPAATLLGAAAATVVLAVAGAVLALRRRRR